MFQPHIKMETAKTYALLPGDPGRVDKVLKYMENVREINSNREYRSCSGEYDGVEISVVSTGIGCPAAAIAVEELSKIGVKTIIRIGTCGGLAEGMQPGDIVIPSAAMCFDGTTREYNANVVNVEADKSVLEALTSAAKAAGVRCFVGVNRTHDAFYEPTKNFTDLKGKGFVSSEMECSAVFFVSKLRGLRSGAILVVNTPEPPEEVEKNPQAAYILVDENRVQKGMESAIKIALEAVRALERKPCSKASRR